MGLTHCHGSWMLILQNLKLSLVRSFARKWSFTIQKSPHLVNVNLVNFPDLVNFFRVTTLLVLWSKITVKIVNYPDLVNFLRVTKKFTKSGDYCIYKRLRSLIHALFGLTVTFFIDPSKIFFTSQNTTRIQWIVGMHEMPTLRTQDSVLSRLFSWCWKRKKSWIEFNVFEWKICIWMEFLEYSRLERISNSILNQIITE